MFTITLNLGVVLVLLNVNNNSLMAKLQALVENNKYKPPDTVKHGTLINKTRSEI